MRNKDLYDKYVNGKHWKKHPTTYVEKFSDFLERNNFLGKLVDIGCGNGRDVNVFQNRGFDVMGLDYDKEEMVMAEKNFPKSKFIIANAEDLPFRDASIGAFFAINVIHYVDQQKTIQEVKRTLVSGGYLFIHFNLQITNAKGGIDYQQNKNEIKSLFRDFSLVQESVFHRLDKKPFEHTHDIMELILRKP